MQQRLKDRKIVLKVTDSAVQLLGNLGYDPNYGARPVKRVIQHYVENELAKGILRGSFKEEDVVLVDVDESEPDGVPSQQKLTFKRMQPPVSDAEAISSQESGAEPLAFAKN